MEYARKESVKGYLPSSIYTKFQEEPDKLGEAGGRFFTVTDVRNISARNLVDTISALSFNNTMTLLVFIALVGNQIHLWILYTPLGGDVADVRHREDGIVKTQSTDGVNEVSSQKKPSSIPSALPPDTLSMRMTM
jgi:2,5-diamino-6-(ribosylamino)-4(3H)-pyrimidinone 5'-phosphate reductase